jgi:hypothetical protein
MLPCESAGKELFLPSTIVICTGFAVCAGSRSQRISSDRIGLEEGITGPNKLVLHPAGRCKAIP